MVTLAKCGLSLINAAEDLLMIRRREFIAGLGGAAAVSPLATRAQQPGKLPTIGFLGSTSATSGAITATFLRRLRELGWVEGRNIAVEYRWTDAPKPLPNPWLSSFGSRWTSSTR